MHTQAAGVDLLCGPDSPLPEARQRYRLLHHLGSGGQAEVYRGVRLSAGVSSSPVTVKVFRPDQRREMLDQLRSWDKGDAVLMDLNSRGVEGICLRVDGFYGLPPVAAGTAQLSQQRIPYQVLDYLPGGTLIDRLAGGAAATGPARLHGTAVLNTVARTLHKLHHPVEAGDSPVLHMDVKPSNVIVLPDGEVRLIDFTTARYDHAAHITTIAHTPESAGPEAFTGHVGPAYDVHGFGSLAYYLVTGWLPRSDRSSASPSAGATTPGGLRRHPLLGDHPALAAHVLAPLADRPEDRPRTDELLDWITHLARLAGSLPAPHQFVDWGEPPPARPQPGPGLIVPTPAETTAAVLAGPAGPTAPVGGTAAPTAPFGRAAGVPATAGAGFAAMPPPLAAPAGAEPPFPRQATFRPPPLVHAPAPPKTTVAPGGTRVAPAATTAAWTPGGAPGDRPGSAVPPPGSPAVPPGSPAGGPVGPKPTKFSGSAPVPPPQAKKRSRFDDATTGQAAARPQEPPAAQQPPEPTGPFRSGKKYTMFGAKVVTACWVIWVITALFKQWDLMSPVIGLGIAAVGAVVVYWLARLAGHLMRTTLDRGPRRGTRVPHFVVMLYLVGCGMTFLSYTPLAPVKVQAFLAGLL